MKRRNEIEEIANGVLKKFGITEAPFSHIKEICNSESIVLKRANLSPSMDGAFSYIQGKKYIFYNPKMIEGRQNFTKAHELGHYFLDHDLKDGKTICCLNKNVSEDNHNSLPTIEREANSFATFFLMPEEMILKEYGVITRILGINTFYPLYVDKQDWNLKNWSLISRHFVARFGVSKEALGYRLDSLGKIIYRL